MLCSECNAECAETAATCGECGHQVAGVRAIGALQTAVQGVSDTSMPTSIVIGGPVSMLGKTMGSYKLLDILGEGGMGTVYLAEHVKLSRKVALKMLHEQYSNTPEVVGRFFAEARAVNKIFHDHIVEITDFIENDDGANYFIMEYLRGQPLGDVISSAGAVPLGRSLGIVVQVCSALSAAHAAGIVHRDLKPDNIFITEKGGQKDYVKLLDFGIAKLLDAPGDMDLQKTQAGMIMGTPEYMSPEQARGKEINSRTDIYSLGVILYELATGERPFAGDTFGDLAVAHATQTPVPPRRVPGVLQDIPKPLEDLILQCLAKMPDERPQTAAEVEACLREIADTHGGELERFDVSARMFSRSGKRRMLVAAAAMLVLGVVSIPVAGVLSGDSKKSEAPIGLDSPEPTVPAAPIVPATVGVTFQSDPPGALVWELAAEKPVGTTPVTVQFAYSEQATMFEFRLEGYVSRSQSITLAQPAQVAVALLPAAEPITKPKPRAKRRGRKRRGGNKRRSSARKNSKTGNKAKSGETRKGKSKQRIRDGAVMNPFGL